MYLIDALNNNKVIGEFSTQKEIEGYLDNKEFSENWESEAESFQEWKEDNFFTVTKAEMKEAIERYGSRMSTYWT